MNLLSHLEPKRVFYYFEEITKIPHGSGNTEKISQFCEDFAKEHKLKYVRDQFNNVVIYKDATVGYENSTPVILQGHIDMVCQKTEEKEINFLTDGLDIFVDGDYIKADGTTLGADNGIAVAMILAVLESENYSHPPIEAVFTTDEETGMDGALGLDMSLLKGKKMINLDSEEDDTMTVSCCGGCCLKAEIPFEKERKTGCKVTVTLKGLQGGHSGVEIHKGRVNANSLGGRILNHLRNHTSFSLVSFNGGDKTNAITNLCKIEVLTNEKETLVNELNNFISVLKKESSAREPNFDVLVEVCENATENTISNDVADMFISVMATAPQGVITMSADIPDLVETSTNLGVVVTENEKLIILHSFRSNKASAIEYLKEYVTALYRNITCKTECYGEYPSWEFKSDSSLQEIYKECYKEHYGKDVNVAAIHAGLECGVFSSGIDGLDCISIGPNMFDVHTVNEKLSVSSTENLFKVLLNLLAKLK